MRTLPVLVVLLCAVCAVPVAAQRRPLRDPHARAVAAPSSMYNTNWTEAIFPVDHFSYTNSDKFKLKYLYNISSHKADGPIFFYAGNEGAIEGFADNTGIMWDLAPQFNAAVIFCEHRYYGQSMPFANNESWTDISRLGFLSSTQALADYAMFLPWVKTKLGLTADTPVIVFGGSYGGMLAAWFRLKFPALTVGAWASSAPVTYFQNGNVPIGGFDRVATNTFVSSGCDDGTLDAAFEAITSLGNTSDGRKTLTKIFNVSSKTPLNSTDAVKTLKLLVQQGFEYMAMTDYPYPTSFLEPMPAWPASAACAQLKNVTSKSNATDLVTALKNAVYVYYNSNGNASYSTCLDPSQCGGGGATGSLDSGPDGWDFQECTEIIIPMCSEGKPNDPFDFMCNNMTGFLEFQNKLCEGIYGSVNWKKEFMRLDAVANMYGWDFSRATNIIFTNGNKDPWSIGGVSETTPGIKDGQARGIYSFLIGGSAHHLDLRQPNTCDPSSVVNARFQIVQIMQCWLDPSGDNCPYTPTALPTFTSPTTISDNCAENKFKYPWGQQNPPPSGASGYSMGATVAVTLCAAIGRLLF